MKNQTARQLLAAILMALILGVVGSMTMDDEQKEQDQYCQMVKEGLWPEFRDGEVNCDNLEILCCSRVQLSSRAMFRCLLAP